MGRREQSKLRLEKYCEWEIRVMCGAMLQSEVRAARRSTLLLMLRMVVRTMQGHEQGGRGNVLLDERLTEE